MQITLSFLVVVVAASVQAGHVLPTTYVSRAPAFDSAVIKSDRLGGNFAYSVSENHAYATHTPVVQHVAAAVPAPVTYAAAAPAALTYAAPAVTYAAAHPTAYASPLAYRVPYAYAAAAPAVAKLL